MEIDSKSDRNIENVSASNNEKIDSISNSSDKRMVEKEIEKVVFLEKESISTSKIPTIEDEKNTRKDSIGGGDNNLRNETGFKMNEELTVTTNEFVSNVIDELREGDGGMRISFLFFEIWLSL